MSQLSVVLRKFWLDYKKNTAKKLKVIDAYLLYILLTGIVQFLYCCLVGTFPFNSFLSGFISTVSCFVLAVDCHALKQFFFLFLFCGINIFLVSLRLQINPENKQDFNISKERAFADFLFANIILHLVVMNFIG